VRALVTRGSGFIGSYVIDALIEQGHEVDIVENLPIGFVKNINPVLDSTRRVFLTRNQCLPLKKNGPKCSTIGQLKS